MHPNPYQSTKPLRNPDLAPLTIDEVLSSLGYDESAVLQRWMLVDRLVYLLTGAVLGAALVGAIVGVLTPAGV